MNSDEYKSGGRVVEESNRMLCNVVAVAFVAAVVDAMTTSGFRGVKECNLELN